MKRTFDYKKEALEYGWIPIRRGNHTACILWQEAFRTGAIPEELPLGDKMVPVYLPVELGNYADGAKLVDVSGYPYVGLIFQLHYRGRAEESSSVWFNKEKNLVGQPGAYAEMIHLNQILDLIEGKTDD